MEYKISTASPSPSPSPSLVNTEFVCTYHFYDDDLLEKNPMSLRFKDIILLHRQQEMELAHKELAHKELTHKELAHTLYQNELLEALQMETFDESVAADRIASLYQLLETEHPEVCHDFLTWATVLAESHIRELQHFVLLFSYDFFHLMQLCLVDVFTKGCVSIENKEAVHRFLSLDN